MKNYGFKVMGIGYFAVFSLLLFAFYFVPAEQNAACAGAIAATPCDPLYYESLEARALLEADREVTQNQNLIYKPDSVLSYTCFDRYLEELGDHADEMFSETFRWGEVLGANQIDHMNVALENLVEQQMIPYLQLNFHGDNTNYLGGRASRARPEPDGDVPDGSYQCEEMEAVWMEAKCYDFQEIPDQDGFFTFEHYASSADKRVLPSPCTTRPPFDANLQRALLNPPWQDDPTLTYLDRFDAAECGSIPPVPTGIRVERPVINPRTYNERVCLQPGCHYQPTGGGASTCVP